MDAPDPLLVDYGTHDRVVALIDRIRYCLESISLEFDRWGESRVYGPGMYVAVTVGPSVREYADPMGENRWPAGAVRSLFDAEDGFHAAAKEVAYSRDGAVVISVDGIVNTQLVRFRMQDTSGLTYAPWMGARHMSALEMSTHPAIIATVTLSEESGRVTVFDDGAYESTEHQSLGEPWRAMNG